MPKTQPFEEHALDYEDWFERNSLVYETELQAVKKLLSETGEGLEIGVGSGRFAVPLGIKLGVEPSKRMREIAKQRGMEVIEGVAEALPFDDDKFDFALMVTTICFLDDVELAMKEAYRVIKPGGSLIIGFIDKNSNLGKMYQKKRNESVFYKIAAFYSVDEVILHLKKAGFKRFDFTQTIFHDLQDIRDVEPIKSGYGDGAFIVVRAVRP